MPLSSMAARAARIRSTDSAKSNKRTFDASPGRILDRQPLQHRSRPRGVTLAATRSGLDGKAALEIAVDGHGHTVPGMGAKMRDRFVYGHMIVRARPIDQANPALVVATVGNPSCTSSRALPMSHGLGITKHPDSWRRRNARHRSGDSVISARASQRCRPSACRTRARRSSTLTVVPQLRWYQMEACGSDIA